MSFATSNPRTVRIQLPSDMGNSITAGGFTFEADEAGIIEVPADLQAAIAAHLPKATTSVREAENVKAIEQLIAENSETRATLEAARAQAYKLAGTQGTAAVELKELQAKKRTLVGDFFLGLRKRAEVEAGDVQRDKAAAKALEEQQARELGAMGVDALNERIVPLDQELAALRTRRSLAVRRTIRASAERAAQAYRAAAVEMATKFNVLAAHGALLDGLERPGSSRADVEGGQCSFGTFDGGAIGPFPAFPHLAEFADCGWQFSVELSRRPGGPKHLNQAEVLALVRQGFIEQGLLAS